MTRFLVLAVFLAGISISLSCSRTYLIYSTPETTDVQRSWNTRYEHSDSTFTLEVNARKYLGYLATIELSLCSGAIRHWLLDTSSVRLFTPSTDSAVKFTLDLTRQSHDSKSELSSCTEYIINTHFYFKSHPPPDYYVIPNILGIDKFKLAFDLISTDSLNRINHGLYFRDKDSKREYDYEGGTLCFGRYDIIVRLKYASKCEVTLPDMTSYDIQIEAYDLSEDETMKQMTRFKTEVDSVLIITWNSESKHSLVADNVYLSRDTTKYYYHCVSIPADEDMLEVNFQFRVIDEFGQTRMWKDLKCPVLVFPPLD